MRVFSVLLSLVIFTLLLSQPTRAADLPALKKLFTENYNSLYRERFCGENIVNFIKLAQERGIDIEGSYALKIVGAGFFETSGFYTRTNPNERAMLGYFHFVFVADNHVIDFDLGEPLVPSLEDYIRLQFTPAREPYVLYGVKYDALNQLNHWTLTRIEAAPCARGLTDATWIQPLKNVVNLAEIVRRPRLR